MSKSAEIRGASRSLVKSIQQLRKLLGTRGPWKRSVSLRDYYEELLFRVAKKRYRARFWQADLRY